MMLARPNVALTPLLPIHQKSQSKKRNFSSGRNSVGKGVLQADISGSSFSSNYANRRCEYFDLSKHLVSYEEAWSWQKSIVKKRHLVIDREDDHSDTLIALQHSHVYTLGTESSEKYLKFAMDNAPYEIYRTDRGGEVTYHGPGQLVVYPILNLKYHKTDLRWYLRSLEQVVIEALSSVFSIKASRVDGLTGVWVGDKKIAAIGIRVTKWITYHGLALNVANDLTPFQHIVPCGIQDRGVVSLQELLGTAAVTKGKKEATMVDLACEAIIKEFSNVFGLSIDRVSTASLDVVKSQ